MKHTELDAMGWQKKLGSTANEQQMVHKPSLLSQTPNASPSLCVVTAHARALNPLGSLETKLLLPREVTGASHALVQRACLHSDVWLVYSTCCSMDLRRACWRELSCQNLL
jgi:hypothetical protein